MKNNLNVKNVDDLIYLEGSCLDNLDKDEISNITATYHKKLNINKKIIKKNPSLFLYDYRSPVVDFNNPDQAVAVIENPAIQPHDSRINSIDMQNNNITFSGKGHSYMNYEDYGFNMNFSDIENLMIYESSYSEFNKDYTRMISVDHINTKISSLTFREVFLDVSNTLSNEISLLFIEDIDADKEKRNIFVVHFEYDSVDIVCKHIKKQKKHVI